MKNVDLLEKYIYDFGWDLWWVYQCKNPDLNDEQKRMFNELVSRLEAGLKQLAEQMKNKE